MKRIMSALIVLAMVFALVSVGETACFPFNCSSNDKTATVSNDDMPCVGRDIAPI